MNSNVLEEVKPLFSFLFENHGFSLLEAYDSPSFGDSLVVLTSIDFRIRFIRDKGQIFIDIGPTSKTDKWYDLDLVKTIVDGNLGEQAPELEDFAVFLENNYITVKGLLVDEKFEEMERAIKQLQDFRAQQLFPKLFKTKA